MPRLLTARRIAAAVVVLSAAVAGCSGASTPRAVGSGARSPAATGVREWSRVPFTPPVPCGAGGMTCRLTMDVFAPARPGPWPLVVMLPGGPAAPDAYASLDGAARLVAAAGAVAFAAPWRQGTDFGGGYPMSFADVSCAIGVARKLAPRYGGQPDRLVLSGHSLGGWAAAVVALSRRSYAPKAGACDATAGSLKPDALVTVSGAVHWARPGYSDDWLETFFGGTRQQRPAAWRAADPFAIVARPSTARAVPVTVVGGGADVVVPAAIAKAFHARLRASGYDARLVLVPGADHGGIGRTNAARRAILAAAGQVAKSDDAGGAQP